MVEELTNWVRKLYEASVRFSGLGGWKGRPHFYNGMLGGGNTKSYICRHAHTHTSMHTLRVNTRQVRWCVTFPLPEVELVHAVAAAVRSLTVFAPPLTVAWCIPGEAGSRELGRMEREEKREKEPVIAKVTRASKWNAGERKEKIPNTSPNSKNRL